MYLLEQISHVAAAAHAPFISAASPSILGLESFTDIDRPRDVSKIFETAEYVQWRSFRDSEDSRYVALTLPHVLGRLPYHQKKVLRQKALILLKMFLVKTTMNICG